MKIGATQPQIEAVARAIRDKGIEPLILPGEDRTAIGIPATLSSDQRTNIEAVLASLDGVSKIVQTSRPFKLASREFHPADTIVQVRDVKIGGESPFVVMAGPCSIESYEQFSSSAKIVKASGATILRGGAFKPPERRPIPSKDSLVKA